MGEFIGVLNGVEFRTRHNDFTLRSASRDSDRYEATQYLEFPDVPPEVLAKTTVDEQVKEMVEWFRAFKDQNPNVRNYTKYFKPILCYLEGAWTTKNGDSIEEPFDSDRHHIDAKSWFDLQEKVNDLRQSNVSTMIFLIFSKTKQGQVTYKIYKRFVFLDPIYILLGNKGFTRESSLVANLHHGF